MFPGLVAFHWQSSCFQNVSSNNVNESHLWDREAPNSIFLAPRYMSFLTQYPLQQATEPQLLHQHEREARIKFDIKYGTLFLSEILNLNKD